MKKKVLSTVLVLSMAACLAACGSSSSTATTTDASADTAAETEAAEAPAETEAAENVADTEKGEGVMTYEEYAAADVDTEVTIEAYVQAHQSWWEDQITVYAQDAEGGYFMYNMACSEEDADLLVPGTKIKVTGYKSEWSGEVEITDATFEIEEGSYIADPVDVTEFLGTDDLQNYQNQFVSFTGMTVEAADDNGAAYLYNWDGSGTEGDDLYFNVSYNGQTYSFTVESYLCGSDTEVYKAVEALEVGQTIDMEGFLYWYEGANPHITSVTVE